MSSPKDIVEAGYDTIAGRYVEWCQEVDGDPRLRFLDELMSRLDDGAKVLELGCGAGVPCTQLLAEHHAVVGVDVSATQLALAERNVPTARFIKQDMTSLDFDAEFDAVTAFYSILHVPKTEQAALFRKIAGWLKPGGLFLAALGTGTDDVVEPWLGAPMFFGSHQPPVNRELLREAGFTLVVDEVVTMTEPEGPATFHWVIGAVS